MRKLFGLLIVGLIVVIGFSLLSEHSEAKAVGRMDILKGSASIVSGETEKEAKTGSDVRATDTIRVSPGSRVSVILKDGSLFRLEENTEISMKELVMREGKLQEVTVGVTDGKIWWKTQPLAPGGSLQVETPSLVATVRGTSFNVSHLNGVSEVYVSNHTVDVWLKAAPGKILKLQKGMKIRVRQGREAADFASGATLVPQSEKSEWIIFNEGEDKKIDPSLEESSSSVSSAVSSASPQSSRASSKAAAASSKAPASSAAASSAAAVTANSSSLAAKSSVSSVRAIKSLVLTATKTSLAVGERTQLFVTAIYEDGGKDTIRDVLWEALPQEVGRVDKTGVFDAKAPGSSAIVAIKNDVRSNTVNISVSGQAATYSSQAPASSAPTRTLVRIAVSCTKNPPPPTFSGGLPTANCSATGYYSDNTTTSLTSQVEWSVTGSAGGSITQQGFYQPEEQGSATISAYRENVQGSTTLSIP